jgi:isoleucyl-tRNA synthetase
VLDRYLLAKTAELVRAVTVAMDAYDLFAACGAVRSYLDALTNWYIRRSRDRFWQGDQDAVDTLHTALTVVCQVAAPLLPFVTEHVFQRLTAERSVHLTDWPAADVLPADPELVARMDRVREVCSAALSIRKANGLRVRLPLASLTFAGHDADGLKPYADLIAEEVNVKAVVLTDDVASVAESVLQVMPAVVGPRLGPDTQTVIRAVRAGDWRREGETVVAGGIPLEEGEYALRLVATDEAATVCLAGGDGVVVLDLEVTEALEAEGLARDLVRAVQQARRDAGLAVSDRIALTLGLAEPLRSRLAPFQDFVAGETLAISLAWADPSPEGVGSLGNQPLSIEVAAVG